MNEHLITYIVWSILALIFGVMILWIGYEMSKPPLGKETKK